MMRFPLFFSTLLCLVYGLLGCVFTAAPSVAQVDDDYDPTPVFAKAEPLGPVIQARPGQSTVLDVFACVSHGWVLKVVLRCLAINSQASAEKWLSRRQ